MGEFTWYNCSAVCGLFAGWLYGGVNGNLLQEGLYHAQVCCTQNPVPVAGHGCQTGKLFKRWEYQTTWPAWEICMQAKKQELELDMKQ